MAQLEKAKCIQYDYIGVDRLICTLRLMRYNSRFYLQINLFSQTDRLLLCFVSMT